MRVGVIINPVSGRHGRRPDSGARRARLAAEFIAETCGTADVVLTRGAGDASALSRAFVDRGVDRVIAWGGDGTINEVAGPLIGSHSSLGIVPSGSGDGFARSLGAPRDLAAAWRAALTPDSHAIDVGIIGDRHFLNIAGIGFDAAVGAAFNRRAKRGGMAYLATGIPIVLRYLCEDYTADLDGQTRSGGHFLIAFANGREYGNGAVLAADADLADGWLNAVVVRGAPIWKQFWRARRLVFRPARPSAGIERLRIQRATVRGRRLLCHADGETFEASGEVHVSIKPGALRIASL
jgi:diacylglycerol kinase (ATP)